STHDRRHATAQFRHHHPTQLHPFHITGDQHLGSTVQYGIDDWNDASWAICTPAVSNIFPRRWYPPHPGRKPNPHSPRNTGEFLDGFGNKVTVHTGVQSPANRYGPQSAAGPFSRFMALSSSSAPRGRP